MPEANDRLPALRKRVAQSSTGPGVYRWLDADGNVLYVGKAKNLRNRLRSYVQDGVKRSAWTEMLVRQIVDFDCTLTNTELEAFMLETNLIKDLKPPYNILMKDDKNYVYLKITMNDPYPRVDVVRRMEKDGSLYFGPKTSAQQLNGSLKFLRTLFPFRTCKMGIVPANLTHPSTHPLDVVLKDRDRPTPCIDHHIKQCSAPCIGAVTPEQYRKDSIDGVVAFFQGKYTEVETVLMTQMQAAAKAKKFERAAELRDRLGELKAVQEKQLISDTSREDTDIIGVSLLSGRAHVVLLKERNGKLIEEENFSLKGQADAVGDVLNQFLPQYYSAAADLPDTIILSDEPDDHIAMEQWLTTLRGKKVGVHAPARGKKSKLLLLAEKNADWKARQAEAKWESELRKAQSAGEGLRDALQLPAVPRRIECYDISHMGGAQTVGSMVVFVDGKPKREHYRSFNMRTVTHGQIDDYQSLRETLKRRLRYLTQDLKREEGEWGKQGITFGKARKNDQAELERMLSNATLDAIDVSYKDVLVARQDGEIIACVRLYTHPGSSIVEMKNVWITEALQSDGLASFMVRRILKTIKKGKVYAIITPSLEPAYGQLGFRYVITPPALLQERMAAVHRQQSEGADENIAMVYDINDNKKDASFTSRPDVILIDGGKGQLAAGMEALTLSHIDIPIASIAKREEEIFIPGNPVPVQLGKESSAQFLLQRLRDEAHRFANDRRERRAKRTMFE